MHDLYIVLCTQAASTQKKILDSELDLMSTKAETSETTLLRRRVAALKREAASLGLLGAPAPPPPISRGRGAGPLSRGVLASRTVDRRPRQLLVTGFTADEKEDVLTHLLVSFVLRYFYRCIYLICFIVNNTVLLKSPGIVFVKFPGPGKSRKSKCKVLESPGIVFLKFPGPGKFRKSKCKVLESPGIVFLKFPGPGKSQKSKSEVLESPGICSAMMWTQTPKYAHPYTSILYRTSLYCSRCLQSTCCKHVVCGLRWYNTFSGA